MLKESYRVLAPGGKVRVATPNLKKFIGLFQETNSQEMKTYTPDPECYILNQELREWGLRLPEHKGTCSRGDGRRSVPCRRVAFFWGRR